MYRVKKVLNHNAVIGIRFETNKEYLLMGKGIGFGRKVTERIEARDGDVIYSLQETTERGDARKLAATINPVYLEIANEILNNAEKEFNTIDRNVLFPLADHIEFAVKRIISDKQISNPLTDDIRVLFYKEFKIAQSAKEILKKHLDVEIEDDEIGYISLHIHSAIQDEKVSQAMLIARVVRECITLVEEAVGKPINVTTLSYNRLMNHVRNMVARVINKEPLKLSMNDYMSVKFPEAFSMAEYICGEVEKMLKCPLSDAEIGYLAMHIERVATDELENN